MPQSSNCVIATKNWIDDANTIVGGAPFLSNLPVKNLRQNRLSLFARTGGTFGTTSALTPFLLVDTLLDINPTSLICFPRHSLSDGATWRIRGLSAFSAGTSNDTITLATGTLTLSMMSAVSAGVGMYAVLRQNGTSNSAWAMGLVTANTGATLSINVFSIGAASGAIAGPWSVAILSPDDPAGSVKYDSRPIQDTGQVLSSLGIANGTVTVTVSGNLYYFNGVNVGIWSTADQSRWVRGQVVSYNEITRQLTISITSNSGSGGSISDGAIARAATDIFVWPTVTIFGQGLWGNDYGWGGRLLKGENYAPPAVHYIPLARGDPSLIYARFWLIELSDGANTKGYIDLSKLVVSPAFQPANNFSYGAKIEWVDPSVDARSRGGQKFVDQRTKYRRVSLNFDNQKTAEAFARFYELDRVQGRSLPFLVIVDPTDAVNLHRQTVFGSQADLTGITKTSVGRYSTGITIEEWV